MYAVLGIDPGASPEEVRRAYKKIAVRDHPDKSRGDKAAEARFMEATEAYETLRDPEKRRAYDLNRSFRTRSRFGDTSFNLDAESVLRDMFNQVRRGAGRRSAQDVRGSGFAGRRASEDIEEELSITLEEAASGCTKELVSKTALRRACQVCRGSGCSPGTDFQDCGSCGGTGQTLDFRLGPQEKVRECPTCSGSGLRPAHPCSNCRGSGDSKFRRCVKVKVPAGIDGGQKLRLAGLGSPGDGGPPGDLYVTVNVEPHDRFHRKGSDLYLDHSVPLTVFLRGGTVSVPTLDGPPVRMEVPAGASPGKTIVTSKGAGIRAAGEDRRGDLHVLIQVELPQVLSARGNKLLEELAEELERTTPKT